MDSQPAVLGIESHVRTITSVMERLVAVIDAENHALRDRGKARFLFGDERAQEAKMRLYQRFETLALIVNRIMQAGSVADKQLFRGMIPLLIHFKQVVGINSRLLEEHLQRQQQMMHGIMHRIESGRTARTATDDGKR